MLDCGLFHSFDSGERPGYVASLARVTRPGATVHVACFGDEGPDTGPHHVSREELTGTFGGDGWSVTAVGPDRLQTRFHDNDGAPAWLATIRRI